MQVDIRDTNLYREAEEFYRTVRKPGAGLASDALDLCISPDGAWAAFAGVILDKLEGGPQSRICLVEMATGEMRVVTFGPNVDRSPKFSADGRRVAFLSDRAEAGDFQLYLLDLATGAAQATPKVPGWVEYLHWSPADTRILLGVAGHGAEVPGPQGGAPSKGQDDARPGWMPSVETGDESYRWRRAWSYDLDGDRVEPLTPEGLNIWDAAWCGESALVTIASSAPAEGSWYGSRLHLFDLATGRSCEIHTPFRQMHLVGASPSGRHVSVIEAVCSDRGGAAGDLVILDTDLGESRRIDTGKVDVTYYNWTSDGLILIAGLRGFEAVAGTYDLATQAFTETWASDVVMARHPTPMPPNDHGDIAFLAEGFLQAPMITVVVDKQARTIRSLDAAFTDYAANICSARKVSWEAPDGLIIQGWLLIPTLGEAPYPLVMDVHGGPSGAWGPNWLGRRGSHILLLKKGYAIFLPNPRGSAGRGQAFAAMVLGDMGGADTQDYLSGLDHLVEQGLADHARLGVTGGSYGGYMTCWLITQDARFFAAVPLAPVTNHVTEYLISNLPEFTSLFLQDKFTNIDGKFYSRSPVNFASQARTPTLNICGALDRVTPPAEAIQFHNALLQNGVESVLLTYPEEGHGVRHLPAAIDYTTRVVGWFEDHLPKASSVSTSAQ